MSCPFCTIPEIKEREVLSNDLAWAFLTNIPIVPGHILIAPKRCIASFDELSKEEQEAIDDLRLKIKEASMKTFDATGFNYAWNDGAIAGQSVSHFHLHVLPRKEGDTGITEYEPRKFLYRPGSREDSPEEELQAVASLIRENL
ncbi:HIT family protein [Candidatus Nomurabacteria bacterium]|nr:HIT family protein [Candidatus Nomurabacteria bacterium]